jgi:hypothetical protein
LKGTADAVLVAGNLMKTAEHRNREATGTAKLPLPFMKRNRVAFQLGYFRFQSERIISL